MGMPVPNCTQETASHKIEFGRLGRRVVEGQFDGVSMTNDAGVMLLGDTDSIFNSETKLKMRKQSKK